MIEAGLAELMLSCLFAAAFAFLAAEAFLAFFAASELAALLASEPSAELSASGGPA